MTWRVDEVDEEARAILALLNEVQVVLGELIEEGDGTKGGKGISAQTWPPDETTPGSLHPTAPLAANHQAGGHISSTRAGG